MLSQEEARRRIGIVDVSKKNCKANRSAMYAAMHDFYRHFVHAPCDKAALMIETIGECVSFRALCNVLGFKNENQVKRSIRWVLIDRLYRDVLFADDPERRTIASDLALSSHEPCVPWTGFLAGYHDWLEWSWDELSDRFRAPQQRPLRDRMIGVFDRARAYAGGRCITQKHFIRSWEVEKQKEERAAATCAVAGSVGVTGPTTQTTSDLNKCTAITTTPTIAEIGDDGMLAFGDSSTPLPSSRHTRPMSVSPPPPSSLGGKRRGRSSSQKTDKQTRRTKRRRTNVAVGASDRGLCIDRPTVIDDCTSGSDDDHDDVTDDEHKHATKDATNDDRVIERVETDGNIDATAPCTTGRSPVGRLVVCAVATTHASVDLARNDPSYAGVPHSWNRPEPRLSDYDLGYLLARYCSLCDSDVSDGATSCEVADLLGQMTLHLVEAMGDAALPTQTSACPQATVDDIAGSRVKSKDAAVARVLTAIASVGDVDLLWEVLSRARS